MKNETPGSVKRNSRERLLGASNCPTADLADSLVEMSTVYVIGAGASHGESLRPLQSLSSGHPGTRPTTNPRLHAPPMTGGFFARDLLDALGYSQAEQENAEVIRHIRDAGLVNDLFGEGAWKEINLEEVFTALEIEREFQNPESDHGAKLLLVRNELVRYIRRIIGLCTLNASGEYYGKLYSRLMRGDSIITFNWDLLLDLEFIPPRMGGMVQFQYSNFLDAVKPSDARLHEMLQQSPGDGLLLKLHGSLNWYRCGNHRCPVSSDFVFLHDTQGCLSVNSNSVEVRCQQCGSVMNPIIVPPVLRKSITEDPVIRAAWGLAWRRLRDASRVVVIGFSAAPTDFYTSWLLRSTVGVREGVLINVINPSNDRGAADHDDFRKRMLAIFPRDYDFSCRYFSEIESVLRN